MSLLKDENISLRFAAANDSVDVDVTQVVRSAEDHYNEKKTREPYFQQQWSSDNFGSVLTQSDEQESKSMGFGGKCIIWSQA